MTDDQDSRSPASAPERAPSERDGAGATPAPDAGDELESIRSTRGLTGTVLAVAALLAAVGLAPMAIGFGPFGARLLLSHEIPVHVLNLSGDDLDVSLSFASTVRVPAGTMETLETLSGGARLKATRPDGTIVDELEIDAGGPVFYNAGGGRCFAVFDISPYYDGDVDEGDIEVVARLDEATRVYEFSADTVVLPRRVAPDQARGTVHWLEPVGCAMLSPENESFLIGQNLVRLRERRERAMEERERARQTQGR